MQGVWQENPLAQLPIALVEQGNDLGNGFFGQQWVAEPQGYHSS